jgi:hypothetical protein
MTELYERWHTYQPQQKKQQSVLRSLDDIIDKNSNLPFYIELGHQIDNGNLNSFEKEWFLMIQSSYDTNMMHLLSVNRFEPWGLENELKKEIMTMTSYAAEFKK